jgi:hypothetical protein
LTPTNAKGAKSAKLPLCVRLKPYFELTLKKQQWWMQGYVMAAETALPNAPQTP